VPATNLDLLGAGDGAKHNLAKAALGKGPIGDAADYLEAALDDGHAPVVTIEDEPGDVLARHLGELLLEDVLEAGQDD
jgi:hypothetical protein